VALLTLAQASARRSAKILASIIYSVVVKKGASIVKMERFIYMNARTITLIMKSLSLIKCTQGIRTAMIFMGRLINCHLFYGSISTYLKMSLTDIKQIVKQDRKRLTKWQTISTQVRTNG